MDRARRASARNALPNRRGLAVEPLEARQLLSVVTVGNRAEFFFTDNAGAAQSIYVENGQARVTFADLTGGQHEIQSVQLLGRSRVRVNLDVSTSVPALTATNVGNISVGGSLDSFTVAAVFGDVSVAGSLGRLQARRVTGSVYVEGDLGDLTAASFPGDLFVQGSLVGTARLTRELGSIHVGLDYNETTDEYEPTGGLLAGILQVGLDVNELRIAASGENAVVRVGRLLRTLELAGDLAGTFEVNGGITNASIEGTVDGQLTVGPSIGSFVAGGGQTAGSVITVAGRVGSMEFGADVEGQIRTVSIRSLVINGCLQGEVAGIDLDAIQQNCEPEQDSARVGEWEGPFAWPTQAIHTVLLPTGEVLIWGFTDDLPAPEEEDVEPWLWNPVTGEFTELPIETNVFCSGMALLPDGRLLVAGGRDHRSHDDTFFGLPDTNIFDPFTRQWTRVDDMSVGRWYPTALVLADGRVLVTSGFDAVSGNTVTDVVEVYTPDVGWQVMADAAREIDLYPHEHLLPSGQVVLVGPEAVSALLDLDLGTWQDLDLPGHESHYNGTSVLLPGFDRVLSLAGITDDRGLATNHAQILDLSGTAPEWRDVAPLEDARGHINAVLLPDGNVFVLGGSSDGTETGPPVLSTEMFNSATETWTTMAPMDQPRRYHSTAILLPDGRVFAAGGDGNETNTAEIYSPPYLFGGPRPEIGRAPDRIGYGGSFVVETPDAADIASVALIRLGSVTHSFNMEQRFVALEFSTSGESLTAHAPTTGAVAPPGYYMLFLVNSAGIPSVASLVQLDSGGLILAATASRDPGETVSPRILSPDAASVVRAEALDGTGPQSLDSPIRPVSHEVTDAALALDLQPTRAEQGPSAQLAAEVAWPNAPRAHHATAAWDIDDLTLASIFIDRLFGR